MGLVYLHFLLIFRQHETVFTDDYHHLAAHQMVDWVSRIRAVEASNWLAIANAYVLTRAHCRSRCEPRPQAVLG
jgi:hypothetical protein